MNPADRPDLLAAYFDRFVLYLSAEDASSMSHQGSCDEDVSAGLRIDYIGAQVHNLDPDDIRLELKGYGAWEEDELSDDDANRERILWIASGNIVEESRSAEA